MSNFYSVSDDILTNIMSRLPAKPFAAAACVNHLWNRISDRILSRPRLTSGISLAESPEVKKINIMFYMYNQCFLIFKYIIYVLHDFSNRKKIHSYCINTVWISLLFLLDVTL